MHAWEVLRRISACFWPRWETPLPPVETESMRAEIAAYEAGRLLGPRLTHTVPTLPVGPPDFTTGPEPRQLPELSQNNLRDADEKLHGANSR